jgi:hypothetical protein
MCDQLPSLRNQSSAARSLAQTLYAEAGRLQADSASTYDDKREADGRSTAAHQAADSLRSTLSALEAEC